MKPQSYDKPESEVKSNKKSKWAKAFSHSPDLEKVQPHPLPFLLGRTARLRLLVQTTHLPNNWNWRRRPSFHWNIRRHSLLRGTLFGQLCLLLEVVERQ